MASNRDPKDYLYSGAFAQGVFQKAYVEEFKSVPKFNLASMPDLLFVLGKIGADSRISDIRWAAYMLGTTFIESSHTVKVTKETTNKKGQTQSHQVKEWRNFKPIEEAGHGSGRKYYQPVKVKRLPTGDARVTEYDGDQWIVAAATGNGRDVKKQQQQGTNPTAKAVAAYDSDDGDEQYFYGRGYVQLTWWSNYAKAGVTLGRGLELLLDPNLVNDPDMAYQIMSTGMCTGGIFANRRQFSQFFQGGHTDYVGARNMVNPGADAGNKAEVAHIAERFEGVLFASKVTSPEVAKR